MGLALLVEKRIDNNLSTHKSWLRLVVFYFTRRVRFLLWSLKRPLNLSCAAREFADTGHAMGWKLFLVRRLSLPSNKTGAGKINLSYSIFSSLLSFPI